jgi:hypothetical protein
VYCGIDFRANDELAAIFAQPTREGDADGTMGCRNAPFFPHLSEQRDQQKETKTTKRFFTIQLVTNIRFLHYLL